MNRAAASLACLLVFASSGAYADAPDWSGSVESSACASAGAGGADDYSVGFEEYSNLRLKAEAGERGTVYAAVNLISGSGSYLPPESALVYTAFTSGDNYAAALELERLYFRVAGEAVDVEAGLLRLAFGFGLAWRPMDFLSPPNPLLPNARPRGVLAAVLSAFPSPTSRIKTFAVAGEDPFAAYGDGSVLGIAADAHGSRASLQGLYAFRTPTADKDLGLHYAGLSVKIEAGAGLVLDALYAYDPTEDPGPSGLQASLGLDYSLLDGDLYVLGQYLYNGPGALAPGDELSGLYSSPTWYDTAPLEREAAAGVEISQLNRRNYLYLALLYRFDDYTSSTLSCAAGLDDLSFSPALTVEHEPFQGMTISAICRVPLDARSFSADGAYGELGPANTGSFASLTVLAKLKF